MLVEPLPQSNAVPCLVALDEKLKWLSLVALAVRSARLDATRFMGMRKCGIEAFHRAAGIRTVIFRCAIGAAESHAFAGGIKADDAVSSVLPTISIDSLPPPGTRLFEEFQMRPNLRLQVGEHLIDIGARRVLTRPDLPRMGSRAMGVLIELVRHCGATVPRNQLRQCVWRNKNVTRDIMINSICELRRFFRDDVKVPKYIESVRHSGYRLIAPSALFFAEPVNDALPRVFDSAIATRIAMNIPMQ